MKKRKLLRKLEKRITQLETSTEIDPTYDPQVPQPRCDPQAIWRDHAGDYANTPDEYWNERGYL